MEPNEGIPENYAENTGPSITALYEQRDPRHTYKVVPCWLNITEYATNENVIRKSRIPWWIGGRFFDKKVAKISYVSASISPSHPVQVQVFGENPLVNEGELEKVARQAQLAFLRVLERQSGERD